MSGKASLCKVKKSIQKILWKTEKEKRLIDNWINIDNNVITLIKHLIKAINKGNRRKRYVKTSNDKTRRNYF